MCVFAVTCYCCSFWDNSNKTAHQNYLLDINMVEFIRRYEVSAIPPCKTKIIINPYNGEKRDFRLGQLSDKGDTIECEYILQQNHAKVSFSVINCRPLKIELSCCYFMSNLMNIPRDNSFNVNDGTHDFCENEKILKSFEKEVLSKIGTFKRDYIQGFSLYCASFFGRRFPYCLFLLIAFVTVLFIWRKLYYYPLQINKNRKG